MSKPLSTQALSKSLLLLFLLATAPLCHGAESATIDLLITRGIYFGAMIIMASYNLLLFFVLRDKNFLFYVCHVINCAWLLFVYLWPNATGWNDQSLVIALSFTIASGLLFTRSFLRTPETNPAVDKILLFHCVAAFICCLLTFAISYRYAILGAIMLGMSALICCLVTGILRWKDGSHAAIYYLLAWGSLLISTLILALQQTGFIPDNLLTQNALQLGTAIEALILSAALANQINTERRLREQAQTSAMASLRQYKALYNNANQGLFVLDLNGKFIQANPATARMLHTSQEALLQADSNLKVQNYIPAIKDLLADPDQLSAGDSIRINGRKHNDEDAWVVLTLQPAFNKEGALESFEGSMVDITDSIEEDAAESFTQAKSAFLATMNHEIRTPMNGVLGMVEMLRGTKLDFHQTRYINTIYNSGQALLSVINDILDYSKIESNKLTVEQISVDLSEVVDECVSVFSNQCEEKNLPLYVDLDPTIPNRIFSDSTRIRQILLSLMSNAFKFTEKGYVYIRIDQLDNAMIHFAVLDTGIGLSSEQKSKLFESFSQADNSTTRKYGGTGLGLAISKRLVELMGGEIGIASKQGAGSKFWFTIKDYQLEPTPKPESIKKADQYLLIVGTQDKKFSKAYQRHLSSYLKQIVAINNVDKLNEHITKTISFKEQFFLLQDTFFESIQHHKYFKKIQDRILILTQPGQAKRYKNKINNTLVMECPVSPRQISQSIKQCLNPQSPINELLKDALNIQGMRFLVAEDNKVNQMVIKGVLKKHGADILVANNGQEAAEKYRAQHAKFDAVLMDIEMPIMNGYEATKAIRKYEAQEKLKKMPIFGLSAHALSEYMELSSDAGMDGFITKPLTIKQLIKHLHPLNTHRRTTASTAKL